MGGGGVEIAGAGVRPHYPRGMADPRFESLAVVLQPDPREPEPGMTAEEFHDVLRAARRHRAALVARLVAATPARRNPLFHAIRVEAAKSPRDDAVLARLMAYANGIAAADRRPSPAELGRMTGMTEGEARGFIASGDQGQVAADLTDCWDNDNELKRLGG